MATITLKKIDDVFLDVKCDEFHIAQELSDFFTFFAPGYKYHPAFKSRHWDGKIRLWNKQNGRIYVGLYKYILHFCKERNYQLVSEYSPSTQEFDDFVTFVQSLNLTGAGKKITPFPHQIASIYEAYRSKRRLILSPTASGKSLIIYTLVRKIQPELGNRKILIVVPTTSLVEQLYGDFIDYSAKNDWETSSNCHQIFEGRSKTTDKPVVFSTWQSIYKMPKAYFEQFGAVIVDECFDENTKILTPIGWRNIKDLNIGDHVINMDTQGNSKIDTVINKHVNLSISSKEKMYEMTFDDGTIVNVTGNHKFLTNNRGWVRADELTETDEIKCIETEKATKN